MPLVRLVRVPEIGVPRTPRLGDTVLYAITREQADKINRRRWDARVAATSEIHYGSIEPVKEGDTFAMVIVKIWPPHKNGPPNTAHVNGQVLLDGPDVFHAKSAKPGVGHAPKAGHFIYQ